MEFHEIEKLRGAENWNIWKFAVKNLLQGTKGAYEVCIGEIKKPIIGIIINSVEPVLKESNICFKECQQRATESDEILMM